MTKSELRQLVRKIYDDAFMDRIYFSDMISNDMLIRDDPLNARIVRSKRREYIEKIMERFTN